MERDIQCSSGSRLVAQTVATRDRSNGSSGPAHAVYFATYEAVKHAMGGNTGPGGEHRPLAAGSSCFICRVWIPGANAYRSRQRRVRNYRE